ncbi:MAG TPA: glycine cleavage T C-terminal barrel domain-containing protein [Acidimicrobiales bacterium]|nr:glycine cleavage T C-terminal barrel domain-containing protein [Acidimicrobiales bacterium]
MTLPEDAVLAEDYAALRHGLAAYRRPRDVLSVAGPDAAGYLQGQCSQDLSGLAVGDVVDALLLEPDGKLAALVRVGRVGDDAFVVDTDAGVGDLAAARLARFRLRSKVDVAPLDWACLALRGSDVPAALAAPAGGLVAPFDWNGVTGVDLLGPDPVPPAGARPVGDAAWEAVRVEAGIPAMGRELDEKTIAAEAALVDRTVSFTKGCYTGQELVARLDARGNKVARRLCGLVVDPPGTDPSALVGADLTVPGGDKPVGSVTSAAWCPGLGAVGALAYLHRSVDLPGRVLAGGVAAEARPLPLV